MATPTNTTPAWKSYMVTGNAADIVASTTVAAAIGTKVDAAGGQIGSTTVLFPTLPSSSAGVTVGNVLADAHVLRAYGAALNGTTDDSAAVNAIIAAATSTITGLPAPSVLIEVPANHALYLASPIVSGTVSLSIRGGGKDNTVLLMKSGGTGVIHHGTTTTPAVGTLQIQDISIVDADTTGSGVAAISAVFSSSLSLFGCMTFNNVTLRYFSQCGNFTNCPRDVIWENVVANGPDNAVQALPAWKFTGTSANTFGNFTGVYNNCRVDNYSYGWDFYSDVPFEGQRWNDSTCYNGWGMVKAYLNPAVLGGTNYQAPIWFLTGCDWQGMGFALDLSGCRMVRVNNCYFACNTIASGQSIPADPNGTSRTYRSVMSFRQCGDITIQDSNIETGGNMDSTSTLVYVASDVSRFRSLRMTVNASESLAGAFEYASGNSNNACAAFNTYWAAWAGTATTCVLDHGNNQINQEAVDYPSGSIYLGGVSNNGRYTIHDTSTAAVQDSSYQLSVTFPTRPSGSNLFTGGSPNIVWSVVGGDTTSGAAYLSSITETGFVVQFANSTTASHSIEYTASGF